MTLGAHARVVAKLEQQLLEERLSSTDRCDAPGRRWLNRSEMDGSRSYCNALLNGQRVLVEGLDDVIYLGEITINVGGRREFRAVLHVGCGILLDGGSGALGSEIMTDVRKFLVIDAHILRHARRNLG